MGLRMDFGLPTSYKVIKIIYDIAITLTHISVHCHVCHSHLYSFDTALLHENPGIRLSSPRTAFVNNTTIFENNTSSVFLAIVATKTSKGILIFFAPRGLKLR